MLDWAAGRFSRRRLLSAGMLGVGGLTLAELMRLPIPLAKGRRIEELY